jgi:hypothetical protein
VRNGAPTENEDIHAFKISLQTLRQIMDVFVDSEIRGAYVTPGAVRLSFAGDPLEGF